MRQHITGSWVPCVVWCRIRQTPSIHCCLPMCLQIWRVKALCFPDSQQPAGRRSETQPARCPWPRSGAGASTRWLHSCTAQRPGGLCTAGQRPVTRRGESRRKWVVTSRSRLPGTAVVPASADPEPPPASCPRETWCCLSRSETCARVRSGGPARTHHSL